MFNEIKKIKDDLKAKIFSQNIFLIFMLSIILLGIIIAIITVINANKYITISNLIDKAFYSYLKCDITIFSFFIKRFFLILILSIIIFLLNFNKYLSFLCFGLMLYLSYFIFFNLMVIIICFGFFGILYSLIMLILYLAYLLLFLTLIMLCRNLTLCNGSYLSNCQKSLITFGVVFGALIIVLILEMILTPFLTSTFIIIY